MGHSTGNNLVKFLFCLAHIVYIAERITQCVGSRCGHFSVSGNNYGVCPIIAMYVCIWCRDHVVVLFAVGAGGSTVAEFGLGQCVCVCVCVCVRACVSSQVCIICCMCTM